MTAPTVLLPHTASRADWLAARRHGVGASDIPKIAGLSKWGGPLSVYYDKTDPLGDDVPPSEAAEIGLALEPTLAKLAAGRLSRRLARIGLIAHPDHPWQRASLDRVTVIGDRPATGWANFDGAVQLKTALGWAALDWDQVDGRVPDAYFAQVQWELHVSGLPVAYLVALAGPSIQIFTVEPDPDYQADLVVLAERFWQQVLDRTPPAADDLEATTALLRDRWSPDDDKIVIADPGEWTLLADAYRDGCDEVRTGEQRKRSATNRTRQILGDAEALVLDGDVVATWKADRRGVRVLRIPETPKPLTTARKAAA